jgi:tetratricopeptide (TPR) repeat protein
MATTALEPIELSLPARIPAPPWRDPHTVSPAALAEIIASLERQCQEHPQSAGLRTCLGMAYAMNFEVYKSMDALETAVATDPSHFWAQLKYAELLYRLRALDRAEEETRRALDLATGAWEISAARKQLQEIRRLFREGTQKPAWTKPLWGPAVALTVFLTFLFVSFLCR